MKRLIASIAAATITTSLLAAPAASAQTTAPTDPVKALKSRIAPGKGVRFTDVAALVSFTGKTPLLRRTGSFQYGKTDVVASDVTASRSTDEDLGPTESFVLNMLSRPERTIRVGTTSYYSGGPWAPPKGKTWVRHPNGLSAGFSGWYGQLVNAAEPATLKALLAKGRKAGNTYSGTISFGALNRISPWIRHSSLTGIDGEEEKAVLRFTLTLGPDQLPRRLVTVYPKSTHFGDRGDVEDRRFSVETRYTGWGSRLTIKAPPANTVVTMGKRKRLDRGGGRG
ncbi:hypothetical protein [Streptosporangium saharense]|uniref:Lipoprotein n=1 Tax=Streptosporangium saharense TaxID=1706840 RepID=A0A7W7QM66_9ACTN|nr:hypothetical protein [Streptosporangium saharense]MBB4915611.1 hypothetical protein [Streptosporangium saharense]